MCNDMFDVPDYLAAEHQAGKRDVMDPLNASARRQHDAQAQDQTLSFYNNLELLTKRWILGLK